MADEILGHFENEEYFVIVDNAGHRPPGIVSTSMLKLAFHLHPGAMAPSTPMTVAFASKLLWWFAGELCTSFSE